MVLNWFVLFFQAAASCYIELIVKESDNNVKLIVLDRLIALKDHPSHEKVSNAHLIYQVSLVVTTSTILYMVFRVSSRACCI